MRSTHDRGIALFAATAAIAAVALVFARPASIAASSHVDVATIAPRAADVGSIDGIVKAYYDVICGPPGQPRQWGRDRTLYIPGIWFVAIDEVHGVSKVRVMSHQDYVDGSDAGFVKNGFWEQEIHRSSWRYGNLVHVFSTYETRRSKDGPLLGRGINSLELYNDGKRWWIASATWQDETPDNPIPKEYLP
jgi:hypothetical protein